MNILTINAGSSSIKYKIFHKDEDDLTEMMTGLIEGIGEVQGSWHHTQNKQKTSNQHAFASHQDAFAALAQKFNEDLKEITIDAVGHRVVHGGSQYFKPTVITAEVLQAIKNLSSLAPIHNPVNAQGIEFVMQYFNQVPHVALFDSGFHHTLPPYVKTYAIDMAVAAQYQIKRYGFHGINHEYVAQQAAAFLKKPLSECNLITLHLGNGASTCLIKHGQSIDTSMGMTPLAGLMMGSRCGDIDPAIPIYLQQQGMTLHEVDHLLNKRSGLIGIAKENDMRHLLSRLNQGDPAAELAITMYVYAIQKTIGGYLTQIPQLDALIFTGGIGENASPIREKIVERLQHMGLSLSTTLNTQGSSERCRNISQNKTPILIIRGDEEQFIANEVFRIVSG